MDLRTQDDETLALLLLEQDQDALAEIVRRYLTRADSLPHGSRSEFRADLTVEREADAFAASLSLRSER
jgi:hypothetical protein